MTYLHPDTARLVRRLAEINDDLERLQRKLRDAGIDDETSRPAIEELQAILSQRFEER